MRNWKGTVVILLAMILLIASGGQAQAETRKKISSINLKLRVEHIETGASPDLTAESNSQKYYVVDLNCLEDSIFDTDDEWSDESDVFIPTREAGVLKYDIELSANDGYYFSAIQSGDIKLNGCGAICKKAARSNNGTTLTLTCEITDLTDFVGEISRATWLGEIANWEPADNAATYSVRLQREGKNIGKIQITAGNTLDFRPLMLRSGSYTYMVTPNAQNGDKGLKTISDNIIVDDTTATQNKAIYGLQYAVDTLSNGSEPSSDRLPVNIGWQVSGDGRYWYRQSDGMYPQDSWLDINGIWYYFDGQGYLCQNRWIPWSGNYYYVGADGALLINTTTPDGYKVDAEGKCV
ncbi:MAG: hypothetical protein KH230_09805 [Enterocloster asparagiformis]|nr:hypothetical protein [Enterocloster asparagiformis]